MERRYGDTCTHLTLSAKAQMYYDGTESMDIFEYETDDGEYRYTLRYGGDRESRQMTEAELNDELENLYDLYWDVDIIDGDSFGAELPENWQEIADFLNREIKERLISEDRDAIDALWEDYWRGEIPGAPAAETGHKIWYAIMQDNDDQDWGTGTFDREEAIERVRAMRDEYPDAYIAVIDDGPDPVCIDEIRDI